MFSRPTLFVIGAGASYELGLPLGEDLKDKISNLLNITFPDGWNQKTGDHQIAEIFREILRESNQNDINPLLHKSWLIRDALPGSISIDNLLDAHRNDAEMANIGKFAIAKAILQSERASKLFNRGEPRERFKLSDVTGTWLIPLLQLLTEGVSKEDVGNIFDNVAFIVFNYDRCLEYFLPRALELYYGLSAMEAEALASGAHIIHPYGRVGEFSEGKALATAAFGAGTYNLRRIAEGIRTFSEGLKFESHREEIANLVSWAEQVVFLGFAFHPLNMEILEINGTGKIKKIFGTTLKLSDSAVRSVQSRIQEIFDVSSPSDDFILSGGQLEEMNLEPRTAVEMLFSHFRSIT